MAIIEQKVPSPGESITEVVIASWIKKEGEYVEKDDAIAEIESDKATLTLNAEENGALKLLVPEGETVKVGQVVCTIDTSALAPVKSVKTPESPKQTVAAGAATSSATATSSINSVAPSTEPSSRIANASTKDSYANGVPSPAAKKLMDEKNISAQSIQGTGKDGRITKGDVLSAPVKRTANRNAEIKKMTPLRKKLSQRLVAVKNTTAMLTTFNEIDMSRIYELRAAYKDQFKEQHGVGLGFMSFFTKAVCEALLQFPSVNAAIDGDNIVYYDYCDVGIAVSAPKGLVVPVLRNAETLTLAQIETEIKALATKARDNKIEIKDMEGGTFTITNG